MDGDGGGGVGDKKAFQIRTAEEKKKCQKVSVRTCGTSRFPGRPLDDLNLKWKGAFSGLEVNKVFCVAPCQLRSKFRRGCSFPAKRGNSNTA